ncbi:hypothetical protein SPRG_19121 [Saprolegnia parasitica CBS 223.65]|uniref:Lysosomal Pro-X carboxypeptidase n=1 Tax=Saprolegnia parasitica (strain CBS 223.65) TaxID=695850 RepID=A0A067D5M9_SAPPC|nr:hypothetical protein SPRG_19121 [Saprolegnia parasitica CBS 223.65]KDO34307.1 hypothetical protein SPRG_19121 [Saprolegnia parasitica CBS 223.65]|eukprot:XP_012195314.1 hypothetical protein SPRG_19121 [Saprolegnia parasitica CBS 223.65]
MAASDDETRLPILEKLTSDAEAHARSTTRVRRSFTGLVATVLVSAVLAFGWSLPSKPDPPLQDAPHDFSGDLLMRCETSTLLQPLDHFGASPTAASFQQRYFTCGEFFDAASGPIFFYTGGHADVELFLNTTGAMWEAAPAAQALLVFAEHRFFGASIPSSSSSLDHLSTAQALADYANVITALLARFGHRPVVAFGGGYGGLLASWLRLKFPHLVIGAVASSAPLLAFDADVDHEAFARTVTYVASPVAGAHPNCIPNIRALWPKLTAAATSSIGYAQLAAAFRLCPSSQHPLSTSLVSWITTAFEGLAVHNHPFATASLPGHPMRAACAHLAHDWYAESSDSELYAAVREAVGVYYNASGDVPCFDLNNDRDDQAERRRKGVLYEYLACTELYTPRDYAGGDDDMFPPQRHNETADAMRCLQTWGVQLRPFGAHTMYGGRAGLEAATNLVLTNGDMDPWSHSGVLQSLAPSVVAVRIPKGTHQSDLYFHDATDSDDLKSARSVVRAHVQHWLTAFSKQ